MIEPKTLWEILVPRCSNEGIEYTLNEHYKWDDAVKEISGGLTILKSAKGFWISEKGKEFKEEMIPVRIYCSEEEIQKIGLMTKKYYSQEKVMYYQITDKVRII